VCSPIRHSALMGVEAAKRAIRQASVTLGLIHVICCVVLRSMIGRALRRKLNLVMYLFTARQTSRRVDLVS